MVRIIRSIIAISLLLGSTSPLMGRVRFGDIEIHAESPSDLETTHGYAEHRISVVNHSREQAHQVTLILPEESQSFTGVRSISRTVEVGPSAKMVVSLWQPPLNMQGANISVLIDGEEQRDSVSVPMLRHAFFEPGPPKLWISSSVQNSGFRGFREKLIKTTTSGRRRQPSDSIGAADLPMSEWSTHWLSYSRFDGIVVRSDEWKEAPPSVTSALWNYVECGGSLFIVGPVDVPSPWRARTETQSGLSVSYVGFGVCISSGTLDLPDLNPDQWSMLNTFWTQSTTPWLRHLDLEAANTAFPVVDKLDVPVRDMLFILLLFVIVIGPVNLLVLSRKRRRVWLLWTIPAISAVTCLAVFVTAIWSESWTARARTTTLTVLDEESHRAATIGWFAFYAPLTPGDGLHFGYNTELTPQIANTRSPGFRTLDWTGDQHLKDGWIQARVPAHFVVRRGETRRERLGIQMQDKRLVSVLNGLGTGIQKVWIADAEGQVYFAERVPAGAKTPLFPAPPKASGKARALREVFASDWIATIDAMAVRPEAFLLSNSYLALLEGAPFAEPGLTRRGTERTDRTLVYGILKGASHEN